MKTKTEPLYRLTTPRFDELSQPEQAAILSALFIGENWGYGNIMAHLATAWATKLREDGMSDEAAINHVSGRSPYPLRKKK